MRGIGSVLSGTSVALQNGVHGAAIRSLFRIQPGSKVENLVNDGVLDVTWCMRMQSFVSYTTGHNQD